MLLFLTTNMAAVTSRANQQYRKIPKSLYFSKTVFEGLIFGEAYIRRKILGVKIDWASHRSTFTVFALFYFVFKGNFPKYKPRGAYIWGGGLNYTWRGLFSEFYGNLIT